jgi:hypothetical protein
MKLDGMAAVRIADTLNERGILSPLEYKKDRGLPNPKSSYGKKNDSKWCATTIIRILNDETYIGTLTQGKNSTPNYKLKEKIKRPQKEWHIIENAHEPIIKRHKFELVQKILRLDTRTSPHSDKVYTFSGILICGCCGNRMTRKTVPYYCCPTTKKRGCVSAANLKESDLCEGVLGCLKAHIKNVASLETLVESLDSTRIAQEISAQLSIQIADNERKLEKIRAFKSGLYETMISGNLSKDEYKSLKSKYTEDEDDITSIIARLEKEVEAVNDCNHERLTWIEHFKSFSELDTIDRKTVIHLIHSIRVVSKTELEITFNYQSEYENAIAILQREVS